MFVTAKGTTCTRKRITLFCTQHMNQMDKICKKSKTLDINYVNN